MPYPSQVSRERILHAASEMVEHDDMDALSLTHIAQTLGIKPPSLYRYFASKAALMTALNRDTMAQLTAANLPTVREGANTYEELLAVARNYRTFAHAHPRRYLLAFSVSYSDNETQEYLVALALPLQRLIGKIAADDSLTYLRGLWALIHGFITLELNQMFQRGGDLDEAFDAVVLAYLNGIEADTPGARS